MKKLTLFFACFLLFISVASAQDAYDFYKKSEKSYDKFQQTEDNESLEEAFDQIEKSVAMIDELDQKKACKVWIHAGEIYNLIALNDYKIFLVNNNHSPIHPEASSKAHTAYLNVIKTADKKWDISNALDELLKTATFISNEGIVAYNMESYEKAFQSFKKIIAIRDFLNQENHISILKKPEDFQKHLFKTALAAQKANHPKEAVSYFEELKSANYNDPAVYNGLYQLYTSSNENEKAKEILADGRKLYPDDEGLMVAEINYYLESGKLNELTDKLEKAIKNNPTNVSLYATSGHVYNELQKLEADKGNFNLSSAYFKQSLNYFTEALEINDTYAPALFNIGALYYNNAAIITKEIQSMESDQSVTGIRAIGAKKSEIESLLEKSLPFFQKAEAINPNDLATLKALHEIYQRKNDSVLTDEFKNRMDQLRSGNQIEKGYFDN